MFLPYCSYLIVAKVYGIERKFQTQLNLKMSLNVMITLVPK